MRIQDIDLSKYENNGWNIERDYGDLGIIKLHKEFKGNASAAAEFLGFKSKDTMIRKWTKLELPSEFLEEHL